MTAFILLAGFLVIITLLLLLSPLWRGVDGATTTIRRQEANIAVFRDQLAELERERDEGTLAAAEFGQAQVELRRRLLQEIPAENAEMAGLSKAPSRKAAVLILLLLPLLAVGGYMLLGTPQAVNPLMTAQSGKMTPEQIQGMVAGLAERLKANPDDTQGWLMLARSYKSLGRPTEAADAYGKVEAAIDDDPNLLTDYADLLAMLAGGSLDGKPLTLINRALHLDPDNIMALWLAGTAAFNRRDFVEAVTFWERAVKGLQADSEDAQMLIDSIAEAKRHMEAKANPAKSVAGKIELAPSLMTRTSPGDTVFIFARPTDGTRFPLAVTKVRVADLPFDFVLDDSLAMVSDKRISGQVQVIVEARISRSGDVNAKDGDLQSKSISTPVGERKLHLVVDQIINRP